MPVDPFHPTDPTVAAAAAALVAPDDLDAARRRQAERVEAGEKLALVEVLLQARHLTLRAANHMLAGGSQRVLMCPDCRRTWMLEWRRFSGQLHCVMCGLELSNLRHDLCLPSPDARVVGEEFGPPLIGRIDGTVHVRRRLGTGRYQGWYQGEKRPHKERVVLLELRPEIQDDPASMERARERFARASALLNPARPLLFELGVVDGRAFLMETPLHGPSLADLVHEHGRLVPLDALRLIVPVAQTMAAAHARGIVGFDLYPEMIVVEGQVDPKLMDVATGTLRRRLPGQLAYLAPERLDASAPATVAADVYGVCAVAAFLLAGEPPVSGMTMEEIERQVAAGQVLDLREACPDLHLQLVEVLQSGLSLSPAARPASIDALLVHLETARGHQRWLAEQARDGQPEPSGEAPPPVSEDDDTVAIDPEPDAEITRELAELKRLVKAQMASKRFDLAARTLERIIEDYQELGPAFAHELEQARKLLVRVAPAEPEGAAAAPTPQGMKVIGDLKRRIKEHLSARKFDLAKKDLQRILAYEAAGAAYTHEVEQARKLLKRLTGDTGWEFPEG